MLRQKYSNGKDIQTCKKLKSKEKNRTKVCNVTKASKKFLQKIVMYDDVCKKCEIVLKRFRCCFKIV